MRPFTEDDAGRFFGRKLELDNIVYRLRQGEREIYVIGPSGSGKMWSPEPPEPSLHSLPAKKALLQVAPDPLALQLLWSEAAKRMPSIGVTTAMWTMPVWHEDMVNFARKYIRPYATFFGETFGAELLLASPARDLG